MGYELARFRKVRDLGLTTCAIAPVVVLQPKLDPGTIAAQWGLVLYGVVIVVLKSQEQLRTLMARSSCELW